jgi:hypothetical protein
MPGLLGEPEAKALLTMVIDQASEAFSGYRESEGQTDLEGDIGAWIAGLDESDPLSLSVKRMLGGNEGWAVVIAGRLRKQWGISS